MSYPKINIELGGRTLSIEINKVARQADGSALVRYGETVLFIAATSKKEVKEPKPFLPLIVDYRENTYAAGKIPGGFFKREGRPSEKEILISRMIDRPVRTLFPDGYYFDTQIVGYLLSADLANEPDSLGLIGASAALYCSDIPFTTPIGAVKVGLVDGQMVLNPTLSQQTESSLNIIVVGTEDGLVMLEAGADQASEEQIIQAIEFAQKPIMDIIQAQKDLYAQMNVVKRSFIPMELDKELFAKMEEAGSAKLIEAFLRPTKKEKESATKAIFEELITDIPEEDEALLAQAKEIFYQVQKKLVRKMILSDRKRPDGRSFTDIRPISIEVAPLPRTHGSALFTRGETQCLSTVTLGTFDDVQRIDWIGEEGEKRFMLHYNFPPFSVGEVSFLRGPGRREIGHGALAEKAILPTVPKDEEEFPYTIRIVSDVLESNGSSSMATVCGGQLALMDAGVPLPYVVAGIAMGLVVEEDKYAVLTDIAGLEDFFGDMDLKIAGSEQGITAIQMDLKAKSISMDILREGLANARQARLEVLAKMKEAIPEPRPEISQYAPRIITIFINPEKVSEVIGPSGKMIKKITAETKAKIDIEDGGKVTIASVDAQAVEKAREMIKEITVEAEIGQTYTGKVIRIEDYGVFVEILPNIVGLLHISEYSHERIRSIRDKVRLGQTMSVKVISIDDDNKVRVSKKAMEKAPEGAENNDRPQRDYRKKSFGGRSHGDSRDSRNRSYDKKRDDRRRF
jgi:polyribonucleotide nucleotidyltransferase